MSVKGLVNTRPFYLIKQGIQLFVSGNVVMVHVNHYHRFSLMNAHTMDGSSFP